MATLEISTSANHSTLFRIEVWLETRLKELSNRGESTFSIAACN